jgi:hypothetical protein
MDRPTDMNIINTIDAITIVEGYDAMRIFLCCSRLDRRRAKWLYSGSAASGLG